MVIPVFPDTLIYLINSLNYAGLNEYMNNSNTMFLSPVICCLTSLLFRLEIVNKGSIFLVTGSFFIVATIGLYVLLKFKFDKIYSLFGAILFGSFNIILRYTANGTIDVPGIALSIWVMIFFINAVNKNPKYYLISFILLVLAIFTRYTTLFLIPLMFLYYFSKNDIINIIDLFISDRTTLKNNYGYFLNSKTSKYIKYSLICSIILLILFCIFILINKSNLVFLDQISGALNGFSESKYNSDLNYMINNTYYLEKFPKLLFNYKMKIFEIDLSFILIFSIIVSFIICIKNNFNKFQLLYSQKNEFKTKNLKKILYFVLIILFIIFILGLSINHMVSNIALCMMMVIIFSLLDKLPIDKDDYALHLLCIAWFLIYFIFFSMINIKTSRYMITVFPPLIFYCVWSINTIFNEINYLFNNKFEKILKILLIIFMIILLFHAFSYETHFDNSKVNNVDCDSVIDYLINHDSNYFNKSISTNKGYISNYFTWKLHMSVKPNYDHQFEDYYISNETLHNDNYKLIYSQGKIYLYQRV